MQLDKQSKIEVSVMIGLIIIAFIIYVLTGFEGF